VASHAIFYERAVPLQLDRHGQWRLARTSGYEFSRTANCVPIMAVEFLKAAREYPLVFLEQNSTILPVGLLGLRQGENFCLHASGAWRGEYVPAYIRRYPFIFAASEDSSQFTLCIDEDYAGFSPQADGEVLFDKDGSHSAYLKNVLAFMKEYELQYRRTREFCQIVKDLELLEPMQARFTLADEEKVALSGFFSVSRDRLQKLSGDKISDINANGVLELMYCHLFSMENFSRLAKVAQKTNST
tara:strand:+ start:74 stop:805 length:732 start_codon:yes stop_codon:yes gene_type:complete